MDLPVELRKEVYRLVFETERITRVHVKRISRKVYDKQERFVCSSRILAIDKPCHVDFFAALEEHAFMTAEAIVLDVADLDFRKAAAFVRSIKVNEKARLMRPGAPKLVIRSELMDVRKFDGDKLGSWLAFCSKCAFSFEYEVGEIKDPQAVLNFFLLLTGLAEESDFEKMARAMWEFKEGVKNSNVNGSSLISLLGLSAGPEDGEEEHEDGDETEGEYEDENIGSDRASDNMSSEEDFTDVEIEAEESGEAEE